MVNGLSMLGLSNELKDFFDDWVTRFSLAVLLIMLFIALFGSMLAPYDADERHYDEDGQMLRSQPPSSQFLLGTTAEGQAVLSRLLVGAQPTLLLGLMGGGLIVLIGLSIGVTAGYVGGLVDSVLMRFTDFAYGIPVIPSAIVLVAFYGTGFFATVFIIGIILWRGNARVFRSQVLQLKERSYVKSAEAMGASNRHIVRQHVLPNMGGMIVLFFALGMGAAILVSASLAFLGAMNPYIPSWGVMLRQSYQSGIMADLWWWTLPPGLMISITVLSTFLIGRGYERYQSNQGVGQF